MTYEELVKNHAGQMIEKLVTEVVTQEAAEVRFEFEDNDQWSIITMHIYEEDKEISLRLHSGERYDLYFGYYDDDDEFFEIIQPLTAEEIKIIPKALQKVMTKVLSDERGMRLPGNFEGLTLNAMGKETVQNFKDSLAGNTVPAELNVYGQSLWWAGKGNWNLAHELIQDLGDQKASRIHAYLHRMEGDLSNAQYWYSKAGEKMPAVSLEQEWEELAVRFV